MNSRQAADQPDDPTKMINQPALQQSRGTIWIVMGGLFLVMSLIPFAALVFFGSGRSMPVALPVGVVLIVLYATILVTRAAVERQKLRLRIMAGCMLGMAAVALAGIWVCSLIENAGAVSIAASG